MQHIFLRYEHAEVFFTYGFLWRPTEGDSSARVFSAGLSDPSDGWRSPLLHERVIGSLQADRTEQLWIGNYQPSFVLEKRCLEWSINLEKGLAIIAPLARRIDLPTKRDPVLSGPVITQQMARIPAEGVVTVRLFDNGSGVITFRLQPQVGSFSDFGERFRVLHWTLRLGPNTDLVPEEHEHVRRSTLDRLPICDSFIFLQNVGTTRLFWLMEYIREKALQQAPNEICCKSGSRVVVDNSQFAFENNQSASKEWDRSILQTIDRYDSPNWRENQAPFSFIVCIVDEESSKRLHNGSVDVAKEVGSLYARLTLDNRYVIEDFLRLSEEYLCRSLGYDISNGRLSNHGHDDRLFFTFCRRGALAVTAAVAALPNIFVVPSLLNLFEVIRARLTTGVLVGSQLAQIAEFLAKLEVESGAPPSDEHFARLRRTVVLSQQSPLEHLFDGGTVTELAIEAEEALLANRVWRNVQSSFEAVDRLRSAWMNKRFKAIYGD